MLSSVWSLIAFLVLITVLVFVHEFGHFWVARRCGVKVERFSIGFGKVLFSRRDKHGTEFAFSAIPLGGYVKMLDSRSESISEVDCAHDYQQKSRKQKALILAAGPLANLIFAIVAFWLVFLIGIPALKPVVGDILPNSIAAQAHMQKGATIVSIDGRTVRSWEEINIALVSKIGEPSITFEVLRPGEDIAEKKVLDTKDWRFNPKTEASFQTLGLMPPIAKVELVISDIMPNSAAAQAGLHIGDEILAVDGHIVDWRQFVNLVQQSNGKELTLNILRNGEKLKFKIAPKLQKNNRYMIGLTPTVNPISKSYRTNLKYGPFDSFKRAVEKTVQLSATTVQVLGKFFTGDISLNNIGGPISIAKGAGTTSELGLVYYLQFMAFISINLGIMNLFPLPVLDGGQLLVLGIEGVRKKALSEKTQDIMYRFGVILLLSLTFFAIFNDIFA